MISRSTWLSLSQETRSRISTFLSLPRTGTTEVINDGANSRVVSDGYTDADLEHITPELLRENLGEPTLVKLGVSTTDVYEMFRELVRRVELPVVEIDPSTFVEEKKEEVVEEKKEEVIEEKKESKKLTK